MNANRRKRIRESIQKIEDIRSEIEAVMDEEDEARDNMPESLHESDRYTQSEEASEALDAAINSLAEASSALEEVV